MSARLRSSSVGAKPRPRIHRPSRAESAAALALDVRCACQFYETKSLLPERVNPVGYNTAEDFEPCVHVNAHLKKRDDEIDQQSGSNLAFSTTSTNVAPKSHSNVCELPPEFAPEPMFSDNYNNENQMPNSSALGNRSASCANMGGRPPTPQFMKQRDPSMSSLLRKRMSEERQGFSLLNKRSSQSTSSRDRFSAQKDPSQSSILRRKMYNRSSGSFERASSEMASTERNEPFQFHQSRIPNERTFYHDSNEIKRNSNMEIDAPVMDVDVPKVEVASPLSMQAQGNRRFLLSSTENLPQKIDSYTKTTSIETEPDSGIDSNFVEDPPRKTDTEKQMLQNDRGMRNRNVSDEEKVQILLSKTQNLSTIEKLVVQKNLKAVDLNVTETQSVPKKPAPVVPKFQLMNVEEVKAVELPVQSKLQYQYMASYGSEACDYSYSKLFDNYKSSGTSQPTTTTLTSNVSSPELNQNVTYVRQRDPSQSRFTQNRYKTSREATPVTMSTLSPIPMPTMETSQEKLLPSAGGFPERRASEIVTPPQTQQVGPQFIRQKDLRTSNVLNRRRRNLSQTSLGKDIGMADINAQATKVTKTISFEKNLHSESDQISPYTGTSLKIVKGVSFEFDRPLPSDRNERNTFDFLHPSASRRPFRDHDYEPIGEPAEFPKSERPVVKITEPESQTTEQLAIDSIHADEQRSIDEYTGTESPIRSITPYTDISRTEDIHTSQIDDSVIEELPLRREDRKKKSFMTNAGEHTKNLQNKISSQASSLRTKFKRSLKSSGTNGQKASGSNLKTSLKSSPKTSQTSPKERKKFKRIDFTNKLKSIHMPKMSKPELPKFKMPEKFKLSRNEAHTEGPETITTITTDATVDEPSSSALGTEGTPTIVSYTEEIVETKSVPKKRFEFGSYPRIFNRFKSQKSEEHDVTDVVSEDTEHDTATQPSSSSFSTHFATVPRTASKIKNSIISKWNKTSFSKSTDRDDSESIPQGSNQPNDETREDSVERRIRVASKVESVEDEEEPLGILQTKEQIQLANYDEENRAIHEISRAREREFKARKPLTHQDSDLVSEESNRDIDWEECERMRNKIMGTQRTPTYKFEEDVPKKEHHHHSSRRPRTDSNFSTEETQSSGSSGDRRRTGVIESIDDDEFFLRQRGVSQDNAEISKYISSAIREGMNDDDITNRPYRGYSYDNNEEDFVDEYHHFDERPRKPLRRRTDGFNRSFESYDDYHIQHDNLSDNEIPVATQYFPRHDDENISLYDNDFHDEMDHSNILSREEHFDSDIDNEGFHATDVKPEVPKRRRKGHVLPKQDSIETNEEVLIYRSEPSFTVPDIELPRTQFMPKPIRKNRSISSKSDITNENRESIDRDSATIERFSPSNSRYTINVRETNGYATVKKEPPARPPPPTRRKRSTKSPGAVFKDSPFPERQKRGVFGPSRPPRRGSSSSLIDPHKPPSIAPSDGTQYEDIDDEIEDDENSFYPNKMQNRPLPPPPRPPRDKRRRRKSDIDKKYDDDNDDVGIAVGASFDDATSEFSTREFIGAEMATQTSMDIDDLYLNDDIPIDDIPSEQYNLTVEEILRKGNEDPASSQRGTFKTSDDNLSKGIQKFRESNQRSYSERSRASTERQSSRPITPSALVIEQRIARSPIQMDATLIMQPLDDSSDVKSDFRTDSAESEYVPYVDEVDDSHLDTEDERIINAAIQRYQMLGNELDERSSTPRGSTPRGSTPKASDAESEKKSTIDVPLPPPRRKSSASIAQIAETIDVPLAEAETLSVASTQELNRITPEPVIPETVNDLSTENVQPTIAQVESLTVVNIQSTERTAEVVVTPPPQETKPIVNTLQITPEVMQEIIERVRETLPIQQAHTQETNVVSEPQIHDETVEKTTTVKNDTESKPKITEDIEEPPKRPPSPTDYTPTSEIPASFYRLRTGISDDESVPSIPPAVLPKHRPRPKHSRRPESSSDDECSRRHHHHSHHGARGQDLSISDLSGQLIRACGRALSSSFNTAGNSIVDFIRSLTKNQDDQQKDLSLVLVILIIIVASLMMLGISGDRSVHHHHWNFLNPPDNVGRR